MAKEKIPIVFVILAVFMSLASLFNTLSVINLQQSVIGLAILTNNIEDYTTNKVWCSPEGCDTAASFFCNFLAKENSLPLTNLQYKGYSGNCYG